jgi:Na+/pantothenate symporter
MFTKEFEQLKEKINLKDHFLFIFNFIFFSSKPLKFIQFILRIALSSYKLYFCGIKIKMFYFYRPGTKDKAAFATMMLATKEENKSFIAIKAKIYFFVFNPFFPRQEKEQIQLFQI